jgi:hypothetical protein
MLVKIVNKKTEEIADLVLRYDGDEHHFAAAYNHCRSLEKPLSSYGIQIACGKSTKKPLMFFSINSPAFLGGLIDTDERANLPSMPIFWEIVEVGEYIALFDTDAGNGPYFDNVRHYTKKELAKEFPRDKFKFIEVQPHE